jgi:hypothetical protein
LDGIEWEVIGCVRRQDVELKFYWDEYLLFNPYEGFRFLIHSEGHFALAKMLSSLPDVAEASLRALVDGVKFDLYHRGVSVVVEVAGEFYWHVQVGEQATYADYISPPFGLTIETPEYDADTGGLLSERSYSIASYREPDEICKAFRIAASSLPQKRIDVFPFQPNRYQRSATIMWRCFVVSAILLVVLQQALSARCLDYPILNVTREISPTERDQEITLGEVTLTKSRQNIEVSSLSPVSNSWVEVVYELESIGGDESAWVSQLIEFYFGSDADGSWSEGKKFATSVGGPLSANTYKVLATVDAQAFLSGAPITLSVRIWADVPVRDNLPIAILLLLISPVLVSLLRRNFESNRWMSSDFSPYD